MAPLLVFIAIVLVMMIPLPSVLLGLTFSVWEPWKVAGRAEQGLCARAVAPDLELGLFLCRWYRRLQHYLIT